MRVLGKQNQTTITTKKSDVLSKEQKYALDKQHMTISFFHHFSLQTMQVKNSFAGMSMPLSLPNLLFLYSPAQPDFISQPLCS